MHPLEQEHVKTGERLCCLGLRLLGPGKEESCTGRTIPFYCCLLQKSTGFAAQALLSQADFQAKSGP